VHDYVDKEKYELFLEALVKRISTIVKDQDLSSNEFIAKTYSLDATLRFIVEELDMSL